MRKGDQIGAWLETLDAARLRAIVRQEAERNEELRSRLTVLAEAAARPSLEKLGRVLTDSLTLEGFLRWGEAGGFTERVEEAARLFAARIADGDPALIELIEAAIEAAEQSFERIEETPDALYAAVRLLHRTHREACEALQPDPAELGERLFMRRLQDRWGFLDEACDDYADVLGEAGQAAYWRALQSAWDALPVLRPGDDARGAEPRRATIEALMEARVKAGGTLDALLRCKEKNLASASRHLELARLCRENGRPDEALQWVEDGLKAFDAAKAPALVDFALALYIARGDFARAEALAWARFERRLLASAYFELMRVADLIKRREALEAQAVARLWAQVTAEEGQASSRSTPRSRPPAGLYRWQSPARDQLIGLYLQEKDAAQVWTVFEGGPVSVELWEKVAETRACTHPDDAIALYHRLLPHAIDAGGRDARYEDAVEVVQAIRKLRQQQGQLPRFAAELAGIRRDWKARRNFMKRLEGL